MKNFWTLLRSRDWSWTLPAGVASLLPFVIFHRQFGELFWFGDEFDLIDQIDHYSLWKWTWQAFAENFVPLFKAGWGNAISWFDGSYFAMLALLWVTHAVNTVIVGRILLAVRASLFVTVFTQVIFALSPGNLETLGWTVQWSAVLAMTFLLLGLDRHFRHPSSTSRETAILAGHVAGSALSFSRGVLTGAVLAAGVLWPADGRLDWRGLRPRLLAAAACLAPAVGVALLIAKYSSGNHQHLGGHLGSVTQYGAYYFALNPLHSLLSVDSFGPYTALILGTAKIALLVHGWRRSEGALRQLLGLLILFDLGNSALLGIGRYHTGMQTAISSRYQYGALLATLPFLALWLEACLSRIPVSVRRAAAVVVAAAILAFVVRRWPADLAPFARSRGTESREVLLGGGYMPVKGAVPGLPSMTSSRAKELIRRYNLH